MEYLRIIMVAIGAAVLSVVVVLSLHGVIAKLDNRENQMPDSFAKEHPLMYSPYGSVYKFGTLGISHPPDTTVIETFNGIGIVDNNFSMLGYLSKDRSKLLIMGLDGMRTIRLSQPLPETLSSKRSVFTYPSDTSVGFTYTDWHFGM